MIKIYLDQKDYINIANGIVGDTRYTDDVECYEYLLSLVNKDKIIVYYSWAHFSETLKHVDKITDSLKLQCEVLDKLTKGNCLLQIQTIIQKEIKYFLLEQLRNEKNEAIRGNFEYAYGKHSDCIEFDINLSGENTPLPVKTNLPIKKEIEHRVFAKSRKELNRLFPNAKNLTKKEIVRLLTLNKESVKKYLDSAFGFKDFVLKYRNYFSKFGNINELSTSRSEQFLKIMELHRDRLILGFKIISEKTDPKEQQKIKHILQKEMNDFFSSIREMISNQYKKEILKYIEPFLKSKNIQENEALITLSDFNDILGVKFYKDLMTEYFIRNSGFSSNPRKLDINDYLDMAHLRYLPYVDCFVTEVLWTYSK